MILSSSAVQERTSALIDQPRLSEPFSVAAIGMRTFGDLLKRSRMAAGMTQEALAERSGLSVRAISDLERGARHIPRRGTLHMLLEALPVSEEERIALEVAARRLGGAAPSTERPLRTFVVPPTLFIGR